jgi:hypothetical protein
LHKPLLLKPLQKPLHRPVLSRLGIRVELFTYLPGRQGFLFPEKLHDSQFRIGQCGGFVVAHFSLIRF